ncbi:MAG: hypothetical protein ACRERD_07500 [Candidatus Binatia bacterium]
MGSEAQRLAAAGHGLTPGSIVRCRNRDWVLLPSDSPDVHLLRPLTGVTDEVVAIHKQFTDLIGYTLPEERVRSATFPLPSSEDLNVTLEDDDVATRYSVTVNVEVRFVRSKARDAIPIQVSNDPNVPAVRLIEEQIRERYPWDYKQLTEKCKQQYTNFKIDKKYHDFRKSIESDKRFAHIRHLDPDNPKSPKKPFFNPNIVNELDKHYERK